jgi:hypothetical protein
MIPALGTIIISKQANTITENQTKERERERERDGEGGGGGGGGGNDGIWKSKKNVVQDHGTMTESVVAVIRA